MSCIFKTSTFITLLLLVKVALASPITYNFEASDQSGFFPPLAIAGPVIGSFQYNSAITASSTIGSGSLVAGANVYDSAVSGLMGSVNGKNFSDASGGVVAGDGVFRSEENFPLPGTDFLLLSFDDTAGPAQNLNGFSFIDATLSEFTLVNVRLFWIEEVNDVNAFLSDDTLPEFLPTFAGGRLALDFEDINGGDSSFFYDLQISVANVNAPSVVSLFIMAIVLIRLRAKS